MHMHVHARMNTHLHADMYAHLYARKHYINNFILFKWQLDEEELKIEMLD